MTHSVSSPQAVAGAEFERSAQGVRSRRECFELAEPASEEASPR
ncbi:hypothetical protein ACT3SQ_17465 [Brachybacterium sp. AOP42-C2-15]